MLREEVKRRIESILPSENVRYEEPMREHTTFRIGGEADAVVYVQNEAQLQSLMQVLKEGQIPYMIMGNGSNLLFSDRGYRGVVIIIGSHMQEISCKGNCIVAKAGARMSRIAAVACKEGLTGFEFAAGIPGTIGGGVVMNAGAYGGELSQVVTRVRVLCQDGTGKELTGAEMEFGYRNSILKRMPYVVTEVEITLSAGRSEEIMARMEELSGKRKEKQPLEYPSAGSTFKRPEGYYAGALIEQAGMKGYRVGDAAVSEKHCGFVVNLGNATCEEVKRVMQDVKDRVWEQFQVELEPEVIVIE